MEMIIYLLEAIFKITTNHNETFVSDAVQLNIEETEEA